MRTTPAPNDASPASIFQKSVSRAQTCPAASGLLPPIGPTNSHRIILAEDPQRPIDVGPDEEDELVDVSGDGIGKEDEIYLEGDEMDDEFNPGEERAGEPQPTPPLPSPSRSMPAWLLDAFNAKVAESSVRGADKLPLLYAKHRTFWFPQESSFFILRRRGVSPQKLYNPAFFLWDPMPLCDEGISCPNCQTSLVRLCHISRPRRCVDFNKTFFMIGYRYRCPNCHHPKTKKIGTVTFSSWDSRILASLPAELAAEFPAQLSHRSGISTALFGWLRSCFQNGMGAKQFSDALRVQHLLKYDELHLQYLDLIASHKMDEWASQSYSAFLPFDDITSHGPHGFVPGATWIRDMYDKYIEDHRIDFNQHTAMLSAEICALDHSHKVHIINVMFN